MTVTEIKTNGNSSKFLVVTKKGEFTLAFSYTLRTNIWKLEGSEAEMQVAKDVAEAIVSRHNPSLPYRPVYIFGEHNTEVSYAETIQQIRKSGYNR